MWHVGIDLHRRKVVIAAVHDSGTASAVTTSDCREMAAVIDHLRSMRPFRAVGRTPVA